MWIGYLDVSFWWCWQSVQREPNVMMMAGDCLEGAISQKCWRMLRNTSKLVIECHFIVWFQALKILEALHPFSLAHTTAYVPRAFLWDPRALQWAVPGSCHPFGLAFVTFGWGMYFLMWHQERWSDARGSVKFWWKQKWRSRKSQDPISWINMVTLNKES